MDQEYSDAEMSNIQIKSEIDIKVEPPEECDVLGCPLDAVKCETEETTEDPTPEIDVTVIKHEPVDEDEQEETEATQTTWCPEAVNIPEEFMADSFTMKLETETEQGNDSTPNGTWEEPNENPSDCTEPPKKKSKSNKSKKQKEPEAASHGDSEIHRCLLCPLEFRQEINLQQHVAWVHFGDRFHSCPHCGRRFFEIAKLSKHMSSTHKTEEPVQCKICRQKFNGKYLLECHTILEHPPSKSTRTISRTRNDKSKMIVEDKVIDRSRVEVKQGLDISTKKLNSNQSYPPSESRLDIQKMTCQVNSVDSLIEVKNESSKYHNKIKISKPSVINSNYTLQLNSNSLSSDDDDDIILEKELHLCPECDKPFTDKQDLQNHLVIHEGVTPLECNKCWKWFLQHDLLEKHLLEMHSS